MNRIKTGCAILVALAATVGATETSAGPLENLERERANVIRTIVDATMSPAERHEKLLAAQRRLVDLERIAIRDPKVAQQNTPVARLALGNYDLTFLVHAGVENRLTITDQWLDQLGLTSAALMNARLGRR
ncbi:MAG: hypothetical protein O3C34_16925 [Proteobacteria bacterium]|nr:hypothetical protein [Pseudomonadota bacterium]